MAESHILCPLGQSSCPGWESTALSWCGEQKQPESVLPWALAPTRLPWPLLGNVIKPSNSASLSACQGLGMHNWPTADYLQVPLGRVKDSISSTQALGRILGNGLFLVNREEMASHVTAPRS